MKIKLSPVASDESLVVVKLGDTVKLNGTSLDFTRLADGATLPAEAISCPWINGAVDRVNGSLMITITMPHGADAGEQSRFPVDIVNPPDGHVPLPTDPQPEAMGVAWTDTAIIDWSQVVTLEMKHEAAAAQHLAALQAEAAAHRTVADSAIAPLQDAVDIDDATDAEVLMLKAWKKYRVALNRLPEQPGYPVDIDWPEPPV